MDSPIRDRSNPVSDIALENEVINSDWLSQVRTAGVTGVTGANATELAAVARHTGSVFASVHMARNMTTARDPETAPRVVTAILALMDPLLMTLSKV